MRGAFVSRMIVCRRSFRAFRKTATNDGDVSLPQAAFTVAARA